jgi:hypothetical protein
MLLFLALQNRVSAAAGHHTVVQGVRTIPAAAEALGARGAGEQGATHVLHQDWGNGKVFTLPRATLDQMGALRGLGGA